MTRSVLSARDVTRDRAKGKTRANTSDEYHTSPKKWDRESAVKGATVVHLIQRRRWIRWSERERESRLHPLFWVCFALHFQPIFLSSLALHPPVTSFLTSPASLSPFSVSHEERQLPCWHHGKRHNGIRSSEMGSRMSRAGEGSRLPNPASDE